MDSNLASLMSFWRQSYYCPQFSSAVPSTSSSPWQPLPSTGWVLSCSSLSEALLPKTWNSKYFSLQHLEPIHRLSTYSPQYSTFFFFFYPHDAIQKKHASANTLFFYSLIFLFITPFAFSSLSYLLRFSLLFVGNKRKYREENNIFSCIQFSFSF